MRGAAKLEAVSRNDGFSGTELSSPDNRDDEPCNDFGVFARPGFWDALTEAIDDVSASCDCDTAVDAVRRVGALSPDRSACRESVSSSSSSSVSLRVSSSGS